MADTVRILVICDGKNSRMRRPNNPGEGEIVATLRLSRECADYIMHPSRGRLRAACMLAFQDGVNGQSASLLAQVLTATAEAGKTAAPRVRVLWESAKMAASVPDLSLDADDGVAQFLLEDAAQPAPVA
jgi:hypothetical protein